MRISKIVVIIQLSGLCTLLLPGFAPVRALAGTTCEGLYRPSHTNSDQAFLIQQLLEQSLHPGPGQAIARTKAQQILQLDEINFTYFLALFEKNRTSGLNEFLKLYPATDGRLIAFPVGASATPQAINQKFMSVNYSDIEKGFDGSSARSTVLVLRKLQAGTGSSMARQKYFASRPEMPALLGINRNDPKLGAKGTDLLVKIEHPRKPGTQVEITIAELQLLQALHIAKSGFYSKLVIQDIVGPETQNRLNQIWHKPSLIDPHLTYAQLFETTTNVERAGSFFQGQVPTINEAGQVSLNRLAPAGHGLFAVDTLLTVAHAGPQASKEAHNRVTAISNGEDLNSLPDPVIVDWTVKNKIPIVLVSTTKTSIDHKGGLLTLVKDTETGELFLNVVETAVAKAAGQLDVFEKTDGLVSTNLTLFNHQVLGEKLKKLSEAELLQAIFPDVVQNWKEQKDTDGVTRKYLQLEGTMGTSIMNLDRVFRKKFGEPLVYVVNIDADRRTDFFSPIKSAFDYFMQFHSDRFAINPGNYKLRHLGGEHLPAFLLKDPATNDAYYQDVQNVLSSFEKTSVRELQDLQVSGPVLARNMVLRGHVQITNETGQQVDLSDLSARLPKDTDGRTVLENVHIQWSKEKVLIRKMKGPTL